MGIESFPGPLVSIAGKVLDGLRKDRPKLELWPQRIYGGPNVIMGVRVSNPATHKIRIRSVRVDPKLFQIWKDDTIDGYIEASDGKEPGFILESGEGKVLPILAIDQRDEHNDHQVKISISWRSLERPERRQIPVSFHLTHRQYRQVAGKE